MRDLEVVERGVADVEHAGQEGCGNAIGAGIEEPVEGWGGGLVGECAEVGDVQGVGDVGDREERSLDCWALFREGVRWC